MNLEALGYRCFYKGSVKNLFERPPESGDTSIVFEFSDAYSLFDWGRMPDAVVGKGEALASLGAHLFRELEREGIRTHFRSGLIESGGEAPEGEPVRAMECERVRVERPTERKSAPGTYQYPRPDWRAALTLIPFEVVFRFGAPRGSSVLKRANPWSQTLFPPSVAKPQEGALWESPCIEFFTKLEPIDRQVSKEDVQEISGLSQANVEELAMHTTRIARWLEKRASERGLTLWDGKLEWAFSEKTGFVLVDSIGPDELRLTPKGKSVPLSKEFLRILYRSTDWFQQLENAKQAHGSASSWKNGLSDPPSLSVGVAALASDLYRTLCWELSGGSLLLSGGAVVPMTEIVRRLEDALRDRSGLGVL